MSKVVKKSGAGVSALVIGLMLAAPAYAQSQAADQDQSDDGNGLQDIVVTAQKRPESPRDVPLSISVQNAQSLQVAGINNIRELNLVTPGLTGSTQGAYLQPAIRGVSTSILGPGTDSPIAIYVDGIYQPGQAASFFDLPDIERVEVLKGPQGTLFGRNATGGAISLYTRNPQFETTGNFSLSNGVYVGSGIKTSNEVTAKGFLTTPLVDDKLAVSVTGMYSYNQGYLVDDVRDQRAGLVRSYLGRAKLLFTPSDSTRFVLTAYYSKRRDEANGAAAVTGVTVASQYPDAIIPSRPWHVATEMPEGAAPSTTVNKGVTLRSEFELGDIGQLTSLTGFSYAQGLILAEVDGAYSPQCVQAFACVSPYYVDYGPTKAYSQELNFASRDFGNLSFVLGAFAYRETADYLFSVNPATIDGRIDPRQSPYYGTANVKTTALAAFGEVSWQATDRLKLIGGLRYSWEKKEGEGSLFDGAPFDVGGKPSWDSFTPRVSALYELTGNLNGYLTYSKGFKSGLLNTITLSNDIANPETLSSFEGGFKYRSSNLTLDVSGFYYLYDDLQTQFFEGVTTVLGNAASARIYGLDFDGTIAPARGLRIRVGGSWIPHADYKSFTNGIAYDFPMTPGGLATITPYDASGERLLRTPKLTGNASVSYGFDVAGGRMDLNTTLHYSSEVKYELVGRVVSDRYATVSAQVAFRPDASNLRVSIWGKNLTHQDYIVGGTLSGQGDALTFGAPRQIGVSLDFNF